MNMLRTTTFACPELSAILRKTRSKQRSPRKAFGQRLKSADGFHPPISFPVSYFSYEKFVGVAGFEPATCSSPNEALDHRTRYGNSAYAPYAHATTWRLIGTRGQRVESTTGHEDAAGKAGGRRGQDGDELPRKPNRPERQEIFRGR